MVAGWKQVVTDSGVERPQVIKYLNEVGEDGWELVGVAFHDQKEAKPMVLLQTSETGSGYPISGLSLLGAVYRLTATGQ